MHLNMLIVGTGEKNSITDTIPSPPFLIQPSYPSVSISLPRSWHCALCLGLTPENTAKSLSPSCSQGGYQVDTVIFHIESDLQGARG